MIRLKRTLSVTVGAFSITVTSSECRMSVWRVGGGGGVSQSASGHKYSRHLNSAETSLGWDSVSYSSCPGSTFSGSKWWLEGFGHPDSTSCWLQLRRKRVEGPSSGNSQYKFIGFMGCELIACPLLNQPQKPWKCDPVDQPWTTLLNWEWWGRGGVGLGCSFPKTVHSARWQKWQLLTAGVEWGDW